MPAGEYTITSPFEEVLVLRAGGQSASVESSKDYTDSTSDGKLVFDKYGNQYFLHEVLCPNAVSLNRELAPSKAEKNARQHATQAKLTNRERTDHGCCAMIERVVA